jgi:antirestriction protein ArdC
MVKLKTLFGCKPNLTNGVIKMQNTVYQEITDQIIAEIEKGAMPWVKPWSASSSAERNIVSKAEYNGINRLILGMTTMLRSYSTPYYGSFKQWQDLGASVKKGEKGTKIVFYKPVVKNETNQKTGENDTYVYSCLKTYYVFNADQVEGYEIAKPADILPRVYNPAPALDDRILKTGANIKHGGASAFFSPTGDFIGMPERHTFNDDASYYATILHELTHWSGAKHRLDRDLSGKFGNSKYAFEELVAELGAAFLCQDYQIQGELRHAGYIQNWLTCLKENNQAIFKAAALAQKAADYINNLDAISNQAAA